MTNLRKHKLGSRATLFQGVYAFTTTGLTKSVVVPLTRVMSAIATPIGAAATATRSIVTRIGAVTATSSIAIISPPYAGTLVSAKLTVDTTHATHNDNHWTFTLVNKGQAAAGTTDMILATSVNSTDADSDPAGSAITAFVARSLSLHGTAANLVTAAGDVLALVCTKAASAVSLSGAVLELTFNVGDPGEVLTVNATVAGTAGEDDAVVLGSDGQTTLTVTRTGANPTSGLKFSLDVIGT